MMFNWTENHELERMDVASGRRLSMLGDADGDDAQYEASSEPNAF